MGQRDLGEAEARSVLTRLNDEYGPISCVFLNAREGCIVGERNSYYLHTKAKGRLKASDSGLHYYCVWSSVDANDCLQSECLMSNL